MPLEGRHNIALHEGEVKNDVLIFSPASEGRFLGELSAMVYSGQGREFSW
jgi:hypothetical protein